MKAKRNIIFKHILNIFIILVGTFIMGATYNIFFEPNNIVMGGFGGFAMIISSLFLKVGITIPVSAIYLLLNAILFGFALKILGKRFGIYGLVGILSYSLFLEVCKFPGLNMGSDLLLSAIYGAVLSGLGMGLTIVVGGSTGGGDMLGCIINHKKPKISVGWVIIAIDTLVVITSIFIYGLDKSLYAIIAIFISGKTADIIIEGPKSVKAFYIISKKSDEISNKIMSILQRGVTSFDAYGKYSGQKLEVLMCLLNARQITELKEIVYDIDKNAFMFSVAVNEAMGKGFRKLEKRKGFLIKKERVKPVILHNTTINTKPKSVVKKVPEKIIFFNQNTHKISNKKQK